MNLLLALALQALPAPAGVQWERVIEDDDAIHYVDPASVARSGQRVRFSYRADLKAEAMPGLRRVIIHGEIDCAARTGAQYRFEGYAADGNLIGSEDLPEEARRFSPLAMDALDTALVARVCRAPGA